MLNFSHRFIRILIAASGFFLGASTASWAGVKFVGGSENIPRHAINSGGESMTGTGLALVSSHGELFVASRSGTGFRLTSGLMPHFAAPGSITSLVTVSKSSGSLSLEWTAPGRDGFLGDITGGVFRILVSSDSGYSFDPSTFTVEVPAAHSPGDTIAYELTGLLPNTTYYSRIYLGDAGKIFADNSPAIEEPTLAEIPVNPVFAGVFSTSVTISWNLPPGTAEGYRMEGSSTNFGALFPGGVVSSSETSEGVVVSLSIENLNPGSTYYFKVASLNPKGESNFTTIIATVTIPGFALPISNLLVAGDALDKTVRVTWDNPSFPGFQGVLVSLSTNPTSSVTHGVSYALGDTLPSGDVVKSTQIITLFDDAGLALNEDYYYHVRTIGDNLTYSVSVSTSISLDLEPMAVAGIRANLAPDRSQITLNWSQVLVSKDGTPMSSTAAPKAFELERYVVSRATSVMYSGWVSLSSMSPNSLSYTDNLPNPAETYYYKIEAADAASGSDQAMVMSTEGELFAVAPDGVTRMRVPPELVPNLWAGSNGYNQDMLIRTELVKAEEGGKVFTSAEFSVVKAISAEKIEDFQFPGAQANVILKYEVDNSGQIVANNMSGAAAPQLSASDASGNLGMYWYTGAKWVKLYGEVDAAANTVSVNSPMAGKYQIRQLLRAESFSFDLSDVSNKVITPNNDGLNDVVLYRFENPRDSAFSGQIFDMTGSFVADMAVGPVANSLKWTGKANGRAVDSGVYIYKIQGEDKAFTGTIVVIE